MSPETNHSKVATCKRCEMPLRINPKPESKATLLRRAKTADGYCVSCAVHDWLRNTYPPNTLLAESGPQILLHPQIREQLAEIMQLGHADAMPDEINWNLIAENWDLPWDKPVKPTAKNPVTQRELDEIASGKRRAFGNWPPREADPLGGKMTINSFDELNLLEPGLGDDLRAALHKTFDHDAAGATNEERRDQTSNVDEPERPWTQKRLFD